jgi:hypothetical protein
MVDLTLSMSEVGISCGNTADGSGPMAVSVESHAFDEEGDVLGYAYSANGGKIIGNGRKIIWDLAGVKPGTYEIKASVDDGCGFCGRSITKKVTVYGTCDNRTESVFSCDCPELMVDGSYDGVRPGDELEFSAELLGKQVAVPVYNWTVKNGKIISGQGTEEITVLTDSTNQTGTVTATVQIPPYDTYCNCPTTATASVPFAEHSIIIDVNQFANVDDLILDETELTLPPRPGEEPLEGTKVSPDMLIDVKTVATDPENDPLTYSYVVSGGRIIGEGSKVMWDLSGVEPGTYKITAGVDDGCGICGKTVTKVIEVFNVPIVDIECPILKINGPSSVTNSSAMKFTATITDIQTKELTYFWAVNNAEIIDGQNSDTITVRIPANASNADSSITLRIGGVPFDWYCPSEIERTYKNGQLVTEETSRRSYQ